MKAKISILIIAYNMEKFIKQCIESVISQSYKNLEIIIVNDGSTDHTAEIISFYGERDKRIKQINQANGGISLARNSAIRAATGEYIMLLDSDDFMMQEMVQEMYESLVEHQADICICGNYEVSHEGIVLEEQRPFPEEKKIFSSKELLMQLMAGGSYEAVVVWNKMFKKELVKEVRFPEGRVYDDDATTYKMIYPAKKIIQIPKRLYFYRQRDGSFMHNPKYTFLEDAFTGPLEWIDFYEKRHETELYNEAIYRYLMRIIIKYFTAIEHRDKAYILPLKKRFKTEYTRLKSVCTFGKKEKLSLRTFFIHPKLHWWTIKIWMAFRT